MSNTTESVPLTAPEEHRIGMSWNDLARAEHLRTKGGSGEPTIVGVLIAIDKKLDRLIDLMKP